MRRRATLRLISATCLTVTLFGAGPAVGMPGCAGAAPGGEWSTLNGDLANSRHQSEEHLIGPENVDQLGVDWAVTLPAGLAIDGTPAVADGCVYVATNARLLYAFNAETGAEVWRRTFPGTIGSSVTVAGGRIFVNLNTTPRRTVALDQATGGILWQTAWDLQYGNQFFATPVVFNGMVFAAMSGLIAEDGVLGGDERLLFRGSYAILDASSGAVITQRYTISDEDFAAGYSGVGLWATPAVDLDTGYLYEGTGNTFSAVEHTNANSIIKIDVDPDRSTFGDIVGVYHGTYDQYVPGLFDKPACKASPSFATCEFLDLDFGASPQLFEDESGRALVGDHQKSGVYHAADADTMEGVWNTLIGLPWAFGAAATASYDGTGIFVAGTVGEIFALNRDAGDARWMMPLIDTQSTTTWGPTQHSQPMSTANGVAYMVDGRGILYAFDSETGSPLLARSISLDAGTHSASPISGVAVARNHVYAPSGRNVVAYSLPSGS